MKILKSHTGPGTVATASLSNILSDEFDDISLMIGEPGWSPSKRILRIPGVVAGDLPRSSVRKLLAWLSHESWERRWSEWSPLDPRWEDRPGLRSLVNGLNDARVDLLGSREFPGAGLHLRNLLHEDYARLKRSNAPPSVRNFALLSRYIAFGLVSINEVCADFAAYRSGISRITAVWDHLDISSTESLVQDAILIYEILTGDLVLGEEGAEIKERDPAPRLPEGGSLALDYIPASLDTDPDPDALALHRIVREFFPAQNIGDDAHKYPDEKDLPHVYSFDPRNDKIYEPTIRGAEALPLDLYHKEAEELIVRLRMALTTNLPLPRRRRNTGKVDRRDLARLIIGHRDIFERREAKKVMSTAAVLMWDESKSMAGERLKQVIALAHVWNRALGSLRIPTSMYGWTTHGRALENWNVYRQEALRIRVYRSFDEAWDDDKVLRRLSKIDYQDGTPTGEALLFGIEKLLERREKRKILFCMTDGKPMLGSHGSEKVHHDFIESVQQHAERSGVEVIGLGIMADLSDHFKKWVPIDSAESIYGRTTDELIETLRSK